MIFPYTKFPSKDPNYAYLVAPIVTVEMTVGSKKVAAKAHLDTGAGQTLINKSWAKQLGLEWKKGRKSKTTGIEGRPMPVYLFEIDLEIVGLPKSKHLATIGFIDSPSVGILLGQFGFYEYFKVTFRLPDGEFEIEPIV
jgi:hypothetical protein